MAAPELLHSAPEIPRQLGELSQLFSPNSLHHLSATLRSLGHPYAILLSQQPNSSKQSAESSIQNDPILPFSEISTYSKRDSNSKYYSENPEHIWRDARDPFSAFFWLNVSSCSLPASSLLLESASIGASGAFIGNSLSSSLETAYRKLGIQDDADVVSSINTISGTSAISAASILSIISAPFYVEGKHSKAQAKHIPLALVIPSAANLATQHESLASRPQDLRVGLDKLILGTASLRLSIYRGQEPFTIKTPDGQPVAEIQPGDPLAALHVSHQAARFRRLSPLEKAHAIVADVTQLLSAIDQTDPQTLNPDQQTTLAKAKDATIIGISHLVRLFRRQTGLPTWKLDVLPPLLQRFHALDSQAVSNQFGGKRKVRPNDIEMLVIAPHQRRQLLASF